MALIAGLALPPAAFAQSAPPAVPAPGTPSGGSTAPSGGTSTSRPPQSTSTAPFFGKLVAIGAGIGAGVGLLTYAGKHIIGGSSPWTAKGAVLAAVGGAVGALAIGTVAFFGTFFGLMIFGDGSASGETVFWTSVCIGAAIGAIAGGLLGAHLGDKWAASSSGGGSSGSSSSGSSSGTTASVGGISGALSGLGGNP